MNLSEKQKKVMAFAKSTAKRLFCIGTIRSGKTYSCTIAFTLFLIGLKNSYNHLLLGRKTRVVETEILPVIKDVCRSMGVAYTYNKTDKICRVGNQTILLAAGEDSRSADKVWGITAHSVFVDEATRLPEEFFEKALSRMTYEDGKLFCTTNPDTPSHWLKTEYVDKDKFDLCLDFDFRDNPSLSKSVIDKYMETFKGAFKDRMVYGLWSATEGLIYQGYKKSSINYLEDPRYELLRCDIGIDYGNTTAAIPLLKFRDTLDWANTKFLHWIPESPQWVGNHITDVERAEKIQALADKYKRTYSVVHDPSAASLRAQLLQIPNRKFSVRRGDNAVVPGIRIAQNALATHQIVVSTKAFHLLEEMGHYEWGDDDAPIKFRDHSCDGMRYVVMDRFRAILRLGNIPLPRGM